MYLVGKIITTHGIKGEVKVKSETNLDRFHQGSQLFIQREQNFEKIIIDSHRRHQNFELITFNGYKNINDVLQYVGCELYVEHKERLQDGEYYIEQLIGLSVLDENHHLLGLVSDVLEVPQGHILEIKNNDKRFLVPFVDEFVKELTDTTIIIHVIEGLL